MIGLTKAQKRLLEFIEAEMRAGRRFPTFEAMRLAMGVESKATIVWLVRSLEVRGAICRFRRRYERWAGIRYGEGA